MSAPEVPLELVKYCLAGECVLFAGTGLSFAAGYPVYDQLMDYVMAGLQDQGFSEDWDRLRELLRRGQRATVEDRLQARAGKGLIAEVMDQTLGLIHPQVSELHAALRDIPFAGVVSTAWDCSLESLFARRTPVVLSPSSTPGFEELLRDPSFFVLKLFGDPHVPETFIFTLDDYRHALHTNELFEDVLAHILQTRTLLCVGMGVPAIEMLFTPRLLAQVKSAGRKHFALLAEPPDADLQGERLRDKYGVKLLNVGQKMGTYMDQVTQFLKALRGQIDTVAPASAIAAPPPEPMTLSRLSLKNVGAFEHFEMELRTGWNVLVGPGGSGKTTALRAIGLGLSGSDRRAVDAGADLLRVGADRGEIVLHGGDQVFRTELIRRRHGGVEVRPMGRTPLEMGRWIVLGFPALRGESLGHGALGGPAEGASRPEARDLWPLLEGGLDPRFDGVEQWLSRMHLLAKMGSNPGEASRFVRMRDVFFRVVCELMPGVEFGFSHVDPTTWQVMVKTSDGIVPLRRAGRSMRALMGWVGALIERVFEIEGASAEPEGEAAIVLIDEVDANMSPEWQSQVVPSMRKLFPHLQVIASSSSLPLLGSLSRGEACRLRREGDQKGVVAERTNVASPGKRREQIPTLPSVDAEVLLSRKAGG